MRKILQIMPAHGWAASFDGENGEYFIPLAGWALVQESDQQTAVIGLLAEDTVSLCDERPGFGGYAFLDDTIMDTFADDDLDDELDDLDDLDDPDEPPPGGKRQRLN